MRKVILRCISFSVFLIVTLHVSAQDCDAILNQGKELMVKGMNYGMSQEAIEPLQQAIVNFEKARNCYFDKERQDNCTFNINLCNEQIKIINDNYTQFELAKTKFSFSAKGGSQSINVDRECDIIGSSSWCNVTQSGDRIIVKCSQNKSTEPRTATNFTINGQTLTISQSGINCELTMDVTDVVFSPAGNTKTVTVTSTQEWDYSEIPSWIDVERDGNTLTLRASRNNTTHSRNGELRISNSCAEKYISFSQDMQNVVLNCSKDNVAFSSDGGENIVYVNANIDSWYVDSNPSWCVVDKNNDGITIRCMSNTMNTERNGSISIKCGKEVANIMVNQEAKVTIEKPELTYDNSFEINFGLMFPNFSLNASGPLVGIVDYGIVDVFENKEVPDYNINMGYDFGLAYNLSIYKGLGLQFGLGYSSFGFSRNFKSDGDVLWTKYFSDGYCEHDIYMSFNEEYKMAYINVPIKFTYGIKFSKLMEISFNTGFNFGFGVIGKGTCKGTLNYDDIAYYDSWDDPYPGLEGSYYANSTVSEEFELFNSDVEISQVYSTGDQMSYDITNNAIPEAPFKRFNMSWLLGVDYRISFFKIGIAYNVGLSNIANDEYWSNDRISAFIDRFDDATYHADYKPKNYSHKISNFQLKVGLVF